MFSKILLKLIDEAVVPAFFLITVRIVSLVIISRAFNIPIILSNKGFTYASQGEYMLVNTYSVLFMVVALCLGLLRVLVKSFVFHDTHISPPLAAKLHAFKMHHLIQDSFHLYTQGLIWLSYLYFLVIGSMVMGVFGLLYSWVAYFSLALAILLTYFFIVDIEKEIFVESKRTK